MSTKRAAAEAAEAAGAARSAEARERAARRAPSTGGGQARRAVRARARGAVGDTTAAMWPIRRGRVGWGGEGEGARARGACTVQRVWGETGAPRLAPGWDESGRPHRVVRQRVVCACVCFGAGPSSPRRCRCCGLCLLSCLVSRVCRFGGPGRLGPWRGSRSRASSCRGIVRFATMRVCTVVCRFAPLSLRHPRTTGRIPYRAL